MTRKLTKEEQTWKFHWAVSPIKQKEYPGIIKKAQEQGILELYVEGEWGTLGFVNEKSRDEWLRKNYPKFVRTTVPGQPTKMMRRS